MPDGVQLLQEKFFATSFKRALLKYSDRESLLGVAQHRIYAMFLLHPTWIEMKPELFVKHTVHLLQTTFARETSLAYTEIIKNTYVLRYKL